MIKLFDLFFFVCIVSQIDKAYPRDFMQVGRVRVQLKKEDGTFVNPAITSSKTHLTTLFLLPYMISIELSIPGYLTRNQRL